jgi:hypothetical protein
MLDEPPIRPPRFTNPVRFPSEPRFDPRQFRQFRTPGEVDIVEGVAAAGRNVGRNVSAVASAAEEAGVAAAEETAVVAAEEAAVVGVGEGLAGVLGGVFGALGAGAAITGAAVLGGAALAAGLLGYGVYLLGKRLHDKFKAAHDKHGQEAALAALARKVESDRSLKIKFEKNLSPEDMQVLNSHIPLHTEVDLETTKRKNPEKAEPNVEQQIPEKQEKRVFADDSAYTIHNMHNPSTQIIPTPKITQPYKTPDISTPAEDKQMFQPPEPEKPVNVAPQQPSQQPSQQPPQQPPPQQPRQSFQDNSINSIHPLNTQQQPRLSAEQYQYIRQRDPGYMV